MRRSSFLALIAAVALTPAALAPGASATAPGDADGSAQASAKSGARGKGRRRAATCKPRGKARARGKARGKAKRSEAVASAKRRGTRGKSRRAKSCGTAKPRSGGRGDGGRGERGGEGPGDQQRESRKGGDRHGPMSPLERRREQMEERREARGPVRPEPPASGAPADGSYTSAQAPGLTISLSDGGRSGRVRYTLPRSAFSDGPCQTRDTPIDVEVALSPSTAGRSGVTGTHHFSDGAYANVFGSIAGDGSFGLSLSMSYPLPSDPSATCSGSQFVSGTLAR